VFEDVSDTCLPCLNLGVSLLFRYINIDIRVVFIQFLGGLQLSPINRIIRELFITAESSIYWTYS
jgi:hypothetical protein